MKTTKQHVSKQLLKLLHKTSKLTKKVGGVILFGLLIYNHSEAQSRAALDPTPPPTQANYHGWSYGFTRGLYVDCADGIIQDMYNGNFASETDLQNYISTNYINQLVLFGLDNNNIVGNPTLEPALRTFLLDMRNMFPSIQMGAAASSKNFLNDTDPFLLSSVVHEFCEDGPQGKSVADIENLMNSPTNARERQEAEILKSVCRLAAFSGDDKGVQSNGWEIPEACYPGFDFLFIEIEYWSQHQYTTIANQNLAYNNLKLCLYLAQKLKCKWNCLRNIDAEFNPSDIAADLPNGYAALSRKAQIKECDLLIDQVMLVDYVVPNRASISFDYKCDVLQEFADVTTKKHSQIIMAYSAEDLSYVKCDGTGLEYYLGTYLAGTDPFNNVGNMYSVEQDFVTLLENQNYSCPNCGCTTFLDNHFTSTSLYANEILGSIWFAYSFMQSHALARHSNSNPEATEALLTCYPNPASSTSKITITNSVIKEIELRNLISQQIWLSYTNESEFLIDNSTLPNGIYELMVKDGKNSVHLLKYVVVK